jgi:hypothetical protein
MNKKNFKVPTPKLLGRKEGKMADLKHPPF